MNIAVFMRLDRLRQDLRFALRSLSRDRSFTLIALTTLALGITATVTSFAVTKSVLLNPLAFPDPDRLAMGAQSLRQRAQPHQRLQLHPVARPRAEFREHRCHRAGPGERERARRGGPGGRGQRNLRVLRRARHPVSPARSSSSRDWQRWSQRSARHASIRWPFSAPSSRGQAGTGINCARA